MDIGAISQAIMETGAGLNLPTGDIQSDGSFFQKVEKALSTMNKVSLKDEQEALDLSAFQGDVTALIMSFYANGGAQINLQDAQVMAGKILGSDAMLDLLSYGEVTLNDIFLSNLNGGVLNGGETLADKIANMDFSDVIDAIKSEISSDIDLDSNFNQLISKVMDEITMNVNESAGKERMHEVNTFYDATLQIRVATPKKESEVTIQVVQKNQDDVNNNENIIKGGDDGRIYTDRKTDYKNDVQSHNFAGVGSGKIDLAEIQLEHPIEEAALTSRVLEAIQTTMSKGNDSLFIKLKPDFLGGIAIRLTMSEGGVVARIVTNSEKTQNMLASQLSNLESSLKEKGIDVARMEVLYNPLNQDGQKEGETGRNQGGNGSPRRIFVDEVEDDTSLQYLQLMGEDEQLDDGVYKA